jgi:hypothetical protein
MTATVVMLDHLIDATGNHPRWVGHGEEQVAAALDRLGIAWEYENPHRTLCLGITKQGRQMSYCPDFYLPEVRVYIEVGNPANNSLKRRKHNKAIRRYPGFGFVLVGRALIGEIVDNDAVLKQLIIGAIPAQVA